MSDSTIPVTIHSEGLRAFSLRLKASAPALLTELKVQIQEAGEMVLTSARGKSKSSRVPGTMRIRRITGWSVSVVAGVGEQKPHLGEAAAFENKGKHGTFRHPLPNNNRSVWVDQQANPALHDALNENREPISIKVAKAVDDVVHKYLAGDF